MQRMKSNSEIIARGIAFHNAIFNPELVVFESMKDLMAATHLGIKGIYVPNVKQFKKEKKEMNSLLIKFENPLLADYVGNELKARLGVAQGKCSANVPNGKFTGIIIKPHGNVIAKFTYNNFAPMSHYKVFNITNARNADDIIELVIKEYNDSKFKSFTIGGGFNGNTLKVKVYDDRVEFNGQTMNFDTFIGMRNTLTQSFGGCVIGGDSTILLTNTNTGTKVYIQRDELQPIVETILGKL
jgi:hypothetical protein